MSKTAISWTDDSWNPVRGCTRVSEGCRHCYAEQQAARIVRMGKGKPTPYDGLVKLVGGEARWTGEVRLVPEHLADPLRWRRPRRIFVNSMSDLFHEKLTNEHIAAVFGVMAACPQHTFQVLTKRPKRMREWFAWVSETLPSCHPLGAARGVRWYAWEMFGRLHDDASERACSPSWSGPLPGWRWPLPNVWLGVSVENQDAADERIPDLLATPASVRFLSCEPLLGPVDVRRFMWPTHWNWDAKFKTPEQALAAGAFAQRRRQALISAHSVFVDWVIAGCESGRGARPCDVEWLRSLRDQCDAAQVAFFLKQARQTDDPTITFGDGSKRKPGRLAELPYLDGVLHAAFPETR